MLTLESYFSIHPKEFFKVFCVYNSPHCDTIGMRVVFKIKGLWDFGGCLFVRNLKLSRSPLKKTALMGGLNAPDARRWYMLMN